MRSIKQVSSANETILPARRDERIYNDASPVNKNYLDTYFHPSKAIGTLSKGQAYNAVAPRLLRALLPKARWDKEKSVGDGHSG